MGGPLGRSMGRPMAAKALEPWEQTHGSRPMGADPWEQAHGSRPIGRPMAAKALEACKAQLKHWRLAKPSESIGGLQSPAKELEACKAQLKQWRLAEPCKIGNRIKLKFGMKLENIWNAIKMQLERNWKRWEWNWYVTGN